MTAAPQPDPRAYIRLAALIRDQIASGKLARGGPLPSIAVLRRKHSHSRQTVAKAMRILEGEGLIYRVPGLGYYISHAAAVTPRDQIAAEVHGDLKGSSQSS
jgi:GntR family transcriptional regulator